MKKILYAAVFVIVAIGMSSCEYDDSNDIDVIKPNDDTTETSTDIT